MRRPSPRSGGAGPPGGTLSVPSRSASTRGEVRAGGCCRAGRGGAGRSGCRPPSAAAVRNERRAAACCHRRSPAVPSGDGRGDGSARDQSGRGAGELQGGCERNAVRRWCRRSVSESFCSDFGTRLVSAASERGFPCTASSRPRRFVLKAARFQNRYVPWELCVAVARV